MISRRRFFTIMVIFLAVFVLFQGLQVARVYLIDIHTNPHVRPREDDVFVAQSLTESETTLAEVLELGEPYVLYVGNDEEAPAQTVLEWCFYAEVHAVFEDEVIEPDDDHLPQLVVVSPECLASSVDVLEDYVSRGVCVVCAGLPDVRLVEGDAALRDFLAIYEVHANEMELAGIHLFGGFLIGGERIFDEETDGSRYERQDLELTRPWYVVRPRTKTFMRGILSAEDAAEADAAELKNEDLPALWWCVRTGAGSVYVIADDSFQNRQIGLGIISAALADSQPTMLYPVINAQVVSLLDFPLLADENEDTMLATYGRSVTLFDTDIVMPQLASLASRHKFRTTCFMSPKFDYSDEAEPRVDALEDVLHMVYDVEGELGISSRHAPGITLEQKQEADAAFMEEAGSDYHLNAVYADAEGLEYALSVIVPGSPWEDVATIAISEDVSRPLVGYVTDDLTIQQLTCDALRHTFTDDLELMGLQTALGYQNVELDMSDVYRPTSEEHEWQNVSRTASEIITTYNEPYRALDRVTASTADERIRDFYDLDYEVAYEDDLVRLTRDEGDDTCWFVLRTHDQDVESVEGGTATKIEDDCYLITSTGTSATIALRDTIRDQVFPKVGV